MHIPSEADSQEMIEPDEVIHISVRNEDMLHTENLSRLKPVYLSKIEENSLTAVLELYIHSGIG